MEPKISRLATTRGHIGEELGTHWGRIEENVTSRHAYVKTSKTYVNNKTVNVNILSANVKKVDYNDPLM